MQAVGHHRDVIEAAEQRDHLQHRAAGIEDEGVAIMNKTHRRFGDARFLMGVDQRLMIDRRIGFILVEYHATVGANDGAGVFQRDQILTDGGAGRIEMLRQLFDRAFSCDCRNSRMAAWR